MNMPRKLVHHGCCTGIFLSQQRKCRNLFRKNRDLGRAYRQLSKRYNDLKAKNNEIIRQLQEQKVLNRNLEKELHSQNSAWMNHATSMERINMEQFIRSMNATFQNMLTHTVELTKHMSSGKSAVDGMRSNWVPTTAKPMNSNNGIPKPTSKTAPIRPMVQGYTVHQPSIFLQRCTVPVPTLEEEMTIDNEMDDRLETIFEESNSEVDSSPVSTNMIQDMVRESINFAGNARKKRSRLGRMGFRPSNSSETRYGGDTITERNGTGQVETQDSAENLSPVMNNVINIRQRNATSVPSSSPNYRRHASPRCSDKEPVVKLQKLDVPHQNLYRSSPECHILIEEDKDEVAENQAAAAAEVDPLEGTSWMFCNTPHQRRVDRRRKQISVPKNNVNVSIVVDDDDDDDDDDIVEASPAYNTGKNKQSSIINNNSVVKSKQNVVNISNSSTKNCSVVCEKIIDTSDNSDVEIVRPVTTKTNTETARPVSKSKTDCVETVRPVSKPETDNLECVRTVTETNPDLSIMNSTSSMSEFRGFDDENCGRISLVILNELIDKQQDLQNELDGGNSNDLVETVDSQPSIVPEINCSTITKRRKVKTATPASSNRNDSRETSHRETPKESMKKKVSEDSNQNLSTTSNFDEFGFPRQERSRRNKAPSCLKEMSLRDKMRRSK